MITVRSGLGFDVAEVIRRSEAEGEPDAERMVMECLRRSVDVYTGRLDGEIACVWGLIPPTLLSGAAYLWLLTTDIVAEHKFLFVRHSQLYVARALEDYDYLIGDCVCGNTAAKRWLEWLGAEFGPPILGRYPFTIRRKG